jgi:hypothetical protein
VHDFTFAETEQMIKENIGGMVIVGNNYLYIKFNTLLLLFAIIST